jgi:hypothetical protein
MRRRRSVTRSSARILRSAAQFVETYIMFAMDAILLPTRDHCVARDQVLVRRAPGSNSMRSSITFVFRFGTSGSVLQCPVNRFGSPGLNCIQLYTVGRTFLHNYYRKLLLYKAITIFHDWHYTCTRQGAPASAGKINLRGEHK